MSGSPPPAGRVLDAGLHLLDRQLVDRDGRLCGKVDDLELDEPDAGGPPVLVALLTGPGVLGQRTRGRLWPGLGRLHRWVTAGLGGGPARIDLHDVTEISHHIELALAREALPSQVLEAWVRVHVIEKIPGAFRAGG